MRKMDTLNRRLGEEYTRLSEKYGFTIGQRKITFLDRFRIKNRTFKVPTVKYVFPAEVRHLLSLPFIYAMIVPVVFLDICMSIYHAFAFPLYGIPYVKRSEYIVFDRKFLDYLNIVQKVNCIYCSYVNGLFAYAVEIAGRTERYWCPIKAARKPPVHHSWYGEFADYGNPEEWEKKFNDPKAFEKLKK